MDRSTPSIGQTQSARDVIGAALMSLRDAPLDERSWLSAYPIIERFAIQRLVFREGVRSSELRVLARDSISKLFFHLQKNGSAMPREPKHLRTYFAKLVQSVARDEQRRKNSRREDELPSDGGAPYLVVDDTDSVSEANFFLLSVLDSLPERDRQIVRYLVRGHDYRSIGEMLRMRPASVAVRVSRFREKLRKLLIDNDFEAD